MRSLRHLTIGRRGEESAAHFLEGKGFIIVDRNVRNEEGEIDIIARDGEIIVFIEVKARKEPDGFSPSERIDAAKIARIWGAAELWLSDHAPQASARIDVIGVCAGKVVEHYEDVGG